MELQSLLAAQGRWGANGVATREVQRLMKCAPVRALCSARDSAFARALGRHLEVRNGNV